MNEETQLPQIGQRTIVISFDAHGASNVELGDNVTAADVSVAACHLMGLASHSIQGCSKIGKVDSDE